MYLLRYRIKLFWRFYLYKGVKNGLVFLIWWGYKIVVKVYISVFGFEKLVEWSG